MQSKIIFENKHFVGFDKAPRVLTVAGRFHPTKANPIDKRPVLSRFFPEFFLLPIHRLDFEVSGVVLFAKSKASQKAASSWFERRLVQKHYEAWTWPNPKTPLSLTPGQSFEWRSNLVRGKKRVFEPNQRPENQMSKAKLAITQAQLLEQFKIASQRFLSWHLSPITGRSHQLRFELSKKGFPIVGDFLYGAPVSGLKFEQDGAIALRSVCLDFSNLVKVAEFTEFELPPKIESSNLFEYFEP